MATQLPMANPIILLYEYIKDNKIYSAVVLYILLSSFMNALTGIDICIPCIWKTITGFNCPGCGLTTAFIHLIKLDIAGAFVSNKLIFIILPAISYFLYADINKFAIKNHQTKQA